MTDQYNELLQEYEQKRQELRKLYIKLVQLRGSVEGVKETPEDTFRKEVRADDHEGIHSET